MTIRDFLVPGAATVCAQIGYCLKSAGDVILKRGEKAGQYSGGSRCMLCDIGN